MTTPTKNVLDTRARRAAAKAALDEQAKLGIGPSSGPASEVRNLKDDPAAQAAAEQTPQRIKRRGPRKGTRDWPD